MSRLFNKHTDEEHNFWMSYTDLMAGFLAVFIIISVILYYQFDVKTKEAEKAEAEAKISEDQFRKAIEQLERTKDSLSLAQNILDSIKSHDLKNQILKYKDVFVYDDNVKVDFNRERGSIILTHRKSNGMLFKKGEDTMLPVLRDYIDKIGKNLVLKTMEIWRENGYQDVELRIEGHTDPTWGDNEPSGSNYSFIKNLQLSSDRANNVYERIFYYTGLSESEKDFVKQNMISIGYSFSSRVRENSVKDSRLDDASRRIEFKIISK